MANMRELAQREERLHDRLRRLLEECHCENPDLMEVTISLWGDAYAQWYAGLEPAERHEVLRRNFLERGKALEVA